MNDPVTDGDGGLILNRNFYPRLGPDGDGDAPGDVVDDLINHLRPLLRRTYPNTTMHKSKRGPKLHFHSPVSGEDPTVDLVVALNRREGSGIWIPNLEKGTWEPSDPEKHVELLNGGLSHFRSTRRKIIRLAKAWNKQYAVPGASSFEISTWGYEFVEPGQGVARGLHSLFDGAATRLERNEPTKDPAGVSANLKLLIDSGPMAKRLRLAADHLAAAISSDNGDEIREALSQVFWNYIDSPATSGLVGAATLLRNTVPVPARALGVDVNASANSRYRAYGCDR